MKPRSRTATLVCITVIFFLTGCGGSRPLCEAIRKDDLEKARKLVARRPKMASQCEGNCFIGHSFPILVAAKKGNLEAARLLLDNGANVNANDGFGNTPLHYAVYPDKAELILFLVDRGANLEAIGGTGDTPLQRAVRYHRPNSVEALIERGADTQAVYRPTHKHFNIPLVRPEPARTLLHVAVGATSPDGKNADRNASVTRIVKVLIRHGADVNALDSDGNSPLHAALREQSVVAMKLLIEYGADVNQPCQESRSLLHQVAYKNSIPCAKILLDHGADPNKVDSHGRTPLAVAVELRHFEIAELLRRRGAK